MGRIPVGEPIPLRFDPNTKRRLDDLAAQIGPRRFGALIRVAARRLLTDLDTIAAALTEYRQTSAVARHVPRIRVDLDLDPGTDHHLTALAAAHDTDRSAIVRVALHRFLQAPGRFRGPLQREDARTDNTYRTQAQVNQSDLAAVERLTGRNGTPLPAAAIRLAVRRLLDDPDSLTADLNTIAPRHDVASEVLGRRTNVHIDDDLRTRLDQIAAATGSDRAELIRLAVHHLLTDPDPAELEAAVTEEIYRGEANRAKLLARNEHRKHTHTRTDDGR